MAEVQPQTEYEWRDCLDALQEAKNTLLSVSGVSPMQMVFGRNPEILGDLLSDNPDLVTNSSFREFERSRERSCCSTPTNCMPGERWKMKGGGILGKRAHHRWRPGICMGPIRGNCWIALPGSVIKASSETTEFCCTVWLK